MVNNGLIDEVKYFYDNDMRYKPLLSGIGYKELFSYYDGDISLEEAIDNMRNSCIEYVWKDIWAEHKNQIAMTGFSVYPDVRGVNSGGGKYTMTKINFILRSVLLATGYINVKDRKNNELVKRSRI